MPGLIETEIHAAAGVGDRLTALMPQVPMGRIGTAEECAEAIVWLMSNEAAYMTGALIPISGGRQKNRKIRRRSGIEAAPGPHRSRTLSSGGRAIRSRPRPCRAGGRRRGRGR
jgi:hypothetical protein